MEPNSEPNRRSNMQRAIANEMTRSELIQFFIRSKIQKRIFRIDEIKNSNRILKCD